MLRPIVAVAASALALAVLAPGCGGDDPDHLASGDGFSIEAALTELPMPDGEEGQLVTMTVVDLEAASTANGAERPDSDDPDEADRWLQELSGRTADGDDVPPVLVPPVELVGWSRGAPPAETEAELGWSLLDVDSLAEVVAPPFRFAVVAGDVDAATLEDADLSQDGDVFSAGEGDDGETDAAGTTPARPLGIPLRMAAVDGRLAASSSTEAVEDWVADDAETLSEDDDLRSIAAALDDAGTVSALLVQGDFTSRAADHGTEEAVDATDDLLAIRQPFGTVGIGWRAEDGEAAIAVAYAFADEAAAEEAVAQVGAAYAEGVSLQTREPLTEVVTLEDVEADGTVVMAHLTLPEGGRPQALAQMLTSLDLPFTHA